MDNNFKIFLKCDISGIQSFIFNVPSQGAAKELKRRSIFVEEISKKCLSELKDFFKGDSVEELYNGGGNFYLDISTKKNRKEIDNEVDRIQKPYLESDIFPYISFIEKNSDEIGVLLMDVNRSMQKQKMQRPLSYNLINATPIRVPDFNVNEIKGINGQVPNGDFSYIAEKSDGDKKLAAIKLDVDNLGTLFMGLSKTDYQKFSQAIKDFFDAQLLQLISNLRMREKIYVVFSGGDDCFMIGSWNYILNLALELRDKFSAFQNEIKKEISSLPQNPITFSAGIVVFTPHYPLLQVAEVAESALSTSKLVDEKNSITLFGKTLSWDEFKETQTLSNTLADLIENRRESKSLLMVFRSVYPIKKELPKVWRLKYFLRRNIQFSNIDIIKPIFNDYEQALLFRYLNRRSKNPDIYLVASRWTELLLKS